MMKEIKNYWYLIVISFSFLSINAQDLEPRSLSAMPINGNFLVASYGYSAGSILTDGSIPIEDLETQLNSVVVAYARSFKLFNKLAKFDAVIPYSFAKFNGKVLEIDSTVSRQGLGDPLFRISMLLIGAKPLNMADFIKSEQEKFKFGVSFRVRMPLGQYDPEKLLNLGANRWAFRFGTAASYTFINRIILEGHLDLWMFTKNKEFFNGNLIEQNPLLAAQMHAIYILKPGIWVTGSFGGTGWGETKINGVDKNDPQKNSKVGIAFAYKLNKGSSLKLLYSNGLITSYGANLKSVLLTYQFGWFDKKE